MDTRNRFLNAWLAIKMVTTCVVLFITLLTALPKTAEALPPRPEVPSPPDDVEQSTQAQAQIQLQVRFPDSWPWQTTHWQDLWTGVQWQDPTGAWHDVEGWRGTLDEVKSDVEGAVTGYKTWWVGGEHMGEGPFRWLVYRSKGGRLLAASESFDLPSVNKATLVVGVPLTR
jgi:hypothetical protein